MGTVNEKRRYYVTPSLIAWAHTQNILCDPILANILIIRRI